jgi:hypothetical protein
MKVASLRALNVVIDWRYPRNEMWNKRRHLSIRGHSSRISVAWNGKLQNAGTQVAERRLITSIFAGVDSRKSVNMAATGMLFPLRLSPRTS